MLQVKDLNANLVQHSVLGGIVGVLSDEYVNLDDGEILHLAPVSSKPQEARTKYLYPGGYCTMGLINITRLIESRLPADGYRLALLIAGRVAPVSNLCHCTNNEYAAALGVTPNRISHLIQKLCKRGFLYRMNPRLVMVNPGWCFRGTPTEHQSAMETWGALHPIGIIKRPELTKKTA
jgi:hypothetical protein